MKWLGSWIYVLVLVIAAMGGLENLRLFIWFSQLCGFIPFRMQINAETKKFERFLFSFRHPLTWWFLFLKTVSLSGLVLLIYPFVMKSKGPNHEKEDTFLKKICSKFADVAQFAVSFSCQLVMFRSSHLGKAVELIVKADEQMESVSNTAVHKDGIIRRTLSGIFLAVASVKWMNRLFALWYSNNHWFLVIFSSYIWCSKFSPEKATKSTPRWFYHCSSKWRVGCCSPIWATTLWLTESNIWISTYPILVISQPEFPSLKTWSVLMLKPQQLLYPTGCSSSSFYEVTSAVISVSWFFFIIYQQAWRQPQIKNRAENFQRSLSECWRT